MTETRKNTPGAVGVRFTASPTGDQHVRPRRSALFNWLFARHQRGTMILRIEDTDAERNKPELVQGIIDGLRWLGVDWDEDPFYQSQRTGLYQAAGKKLLANGSAFLCYCPAERYAGGDHAVDAQDDEPKAAGPLILGPDKSRLSKRHGATDVNMYRTEGFLPEAFRNFLALLGWSAGGDEEFLRTKDLLEKFSLEGVSRTNAVFDRPKLEWFNTQYLQKLPIEELLPEVEAELKRSKLWKDEWAGGAGRNWFAKTVDLLRPRVRLLPDFSTWSRAFFSDDFEIDPDANAKFCKEPKVPVLISKLAEKLAAISSTDWNHDACDHALRALAEAEGVKAGLLINATRVAIVGQAVAPPLFDTMVVLGRDRVVNRLRRALPSLTAPWVNPSMELA